MRSADIIEALRKCGQTGIDLCDGKLDSAVKRCTGCVNENRMKQSNARPCFETWLEAADMLERLEAEIVELKKERGSRD